MWGSTLVVRTGGDPRPLTAAIREQVLAVDPNQPVYDVKTMEERVAVTLETRRFAVVLLGIFGALGLLLAAIGLYGVLAFTVSQRTREIGIHMALGAPARDVMFMVMKQGIALVLVGVVIGVAGAYAATRAIRSLLFEIGPTDPLTFVVVLVLLSFVGLIASYVPARRMRSDVRFTAIASGCASTPASSGSGNASGVKKSQCVCTTYPTTAPWATSPAACAAC